MLIFVLLLWADRRFRLGHGRVFALYVAGYTAGRFWIELLRDDAATMIFGQRVNTWVSAIVFIGAVIVFLALSKGRETPEEVDPKYHAEQKKEGRPEENSSAGEWREVPAAGSTAASGKKTPGKR